MNIIVTGKAGVGKTTLLKGTNLKNVIHADNFVKNNYYKVGHVVAQQISDTFGSNFLDDKKVVTKKLGKLVFTEPEAMKLLNNMILHEFSKQLTEWQNDDKVYIIEMANYINREEDYKAFADKVILIEKKEPIFDNKFKYMDEMINPIEDKKIDYDEKISNDGEIQAGVNKLKKAIKKHS